MERGVASVSDRTAKDYAIEHGGYLATAAETYLNAKNAYDMAVAGYADENSEVPNSDELSDCHQALRVAIFEFRKRAEKAGADFARSELEAATPDPGNYVCDDEVFPTKATFSNGRVVAIIQRSDGKGACLEISPKSEYPKPCGICDGVIQSAADLDWHGYGNCREIPDAVMDTTQSELAAAQQEIARLRDWQTKIIATIDLLPSITGLSPVQNPKDAWMAIRDLQAAWKDANSGRNSIAKKLQTVEESERGRHQRIKTMEESLRAAQDRIAELEAVIERDRTKVCDEVNVLKCVIRSREWLGEGRGPYGWDDDHWHQEFIETAREIRDALAGLEKLAADLSNSPKTHEAVVAARAAQLKEK
jgi:hypothetical protein